MVAFGQVEDSRAALSLDLVNAAALGGPIVTYQFRAGVAFHFGVDRQAQPPAPAQAPPAEPPAAEPPAAPMDSYAPP